jgi:hypothetical protein
MPLRWIGIGRNHDAGTSGVKPLSHRSLEALFSAMVASVRWPTPSPRRGAPEASSVSRGCGNDRSPDVDEADAEAGGDRR